MKGEVEYNNIAAQPETIKFQLNYRIRLYKYFNFCRKSQAELRDKIDSLAVGKIVIKSVSVRHPCYFMYRIEEVI